ncbi:hypothetical protein NKG05_13135 [Oerskovia sp. M15]
MPVLEPQRRGPQEVPHADPCRRAPGDAQRLDQVVGERLGMRRGMAVEEDSQRPVARPLRDERRDPGDDDVPADRFDAHGVRIVRGPATVGGRGEIWALSA